MRIAVLSDIHGNIDALKAVLADCDSCKPGVEGYVFLGDLVFFGLCPQECFDLIMARNPIIKIKGNTDGNLEEVDTFKPSGEFERQLLDCIRDCCDRLSPQAVSELAGWPISQVFEISGNHVVFCHGSPYSFSDKLLPDGRTNGALADKLARDEFPLIVCGHTHCCGDFRIGGTHIVNVGAIGYCFDGDARAKYGLIDFDEKGVRCEIRKVNYERTGYLAGLQAISRRLPLFRGIVYAVEHGCPMPRECLTGKTC